ncbi:MAG: UDP-N-acetylmuramoyl-L-alanyl-D-glutamate--2,6-diaminopimelate ligase [Oscillospiraceae bacterium]|jgi:UDP-N-acetylmuramoyl-L-alanyl-D-glutamate--2,6-diaminopimelate ligase|nr:UDP-N-acetylmuramoyl-L-alanyl-D-glutamate--2,6-diaminopimelate ligase [Oscillospiraceae bacterium]
MRLLELIMELESMETNADLDTDITGVYNDSRLVEPGGLFVAVSGSEHDGHIYIPKALQQGAAVVVTEKPLTHAVPYVVVPDTKEALGRLNSAFFSHPSREMTMVGVTGTSGKTTVTHLLYALLAKMPGAVPALIGTNHILFAGRETPSHHTTPDAVQLHSLLREMADEGCTHCVMEVSSHSLEQKRVAGIHFHTAVFTNLSHEHLDYHKNMENYFRSKALLFEQCTHGYVNSDDLYGKRLKDTYSLGDYAVDSAAQMKAENVVSAPGGVDFTVCFEGQKTHMRWGTPGLFTVYNILAATRAASGLGIPPEEAATIIEGIPPVCGRMEKVANPAGIDIIIDYAHKPDALEKVLSALRPLAVGRLITVFGCGGDRDREKRPKMGAIAENLSDTVIVTSDNPRAEDPVKIIADITAGMPGGGHITVPDRREAIFTALGMAKPGDMVALCGKGHEMYQEIHGARYPMDEREIVAAYWRNEDA